MKDRASHQIRYLYHAESLEENEFDRPIANADPAPSDNGVPDDVAQRYFQSHAYP
ncbi:MAG: hypothetical protein AAGF15_12505 [Pseudomonadota bacterium]